MLSPPEKPEISQSPISPETPVKKIKLDQITRNYSQAAEDEAQTETQTNKKWKDGIWFDGLTWFCDWLFTLFLGFKSKPESKSTF